MLQHPHAGSEGYHIRHPLWELSSGTPGGSDEAFNKRENVSLEYFVIPLCIYSQWIKHTQYYMQGRNVGYTTSYFMSTTLASWFKIIRKTSKDTHFLQIINWYWHSSSTIIWNSWFGVLQEIKKRVDDEFGETRGHRQSHCTERCRGRYRVGGWGIIPLSVNRMSTVLQMTT